MTVIRYILVILLSYVLGCSNMALYLSKLRGVDMRKGGSGNLGASNAMILMGWKAGIIVAVHDIGKAVVAVVLAKHFCPGLPLIGAAAGVACVLGHMFPFYLRFRGGKGLASYLGMTIALNWKFALAHSARRRGNRDAHHGLYRRRHRDHRYSRADLFRHHGGERAARVHPLRGDGRDNHKA